MLTQNNISLLHSNYIERNNEFALIAERILEAKKLMTYYENICTDLMKRLTEISEGQNSRGGGFIFYSVKRKGAVDYMKIPGIQSIDIEQYRKSDITYWKVERE